MTDMNLLAPPSLKQLNMYLKIGIEHDEKDVVVAYYGEFIHGVTYYSNLTARLYAMQKGMEIKDKTKPDQVFLLNLMELLEHMKSANSSNDLFKSEAAAKTHIQDYALRLFKAAYDKDYSANFGPATVKQFYTSGMLLDILDLFGPIDEELEKARKYGKWKAIYLTRCNKTGQEPEAGPILDAGEEAQGPDMDKLPFPTQAAPPPPAAAPAPQPMASPAAHPVPPPTSVAPISPPSVPAPDSGITLGIEHYNEAEKKAKYAVSAMKYQDRETAIKMLQESLEILCLGKM